MRKKGLSRESIPQCGVFAQLPAVPNEKDKILDKRMCSTWLGTRMSFLIRADCYGIKQLLFPAGEALSEVEGRGI